MRCIPAESPSRRPGKDRLGAAHAVFIDLVEAGRAQRLSLQVELLIISRDARVADQHGISGGQETSQSKTYLTIDNLTGFYA